MERSWKEAFMKRASTKDPPPGKQAQPIKTNRLALVSSWLGLATVLACILTLCAGLGLAMRMSNEFNDPAAILAVRVTLLGGVASLGLMVAAGLTGTMALEQIGRSAGREKGRPLAWGGIAATVLALPPVCLVLMLYITAYFGA
jgi:hypothetical protein